MGGFPKQGAKVGWLHEKALRKGEGKKKGGA
jgi:hypothetical protein